MLWPGSIITVSERIPTGGVIMYALMAAGGDLGASVGPELVGVITDVVSGSARMVAFADSLGFTGEQFGIVSLIITVAGIFSGAICLNLVDKLVPHLHKLAGDDIESHKSTNLSKVLLFVTAIAIHNLPEGIAAGVGFGSGNTAQALIIAGGIALQNIPEGMVIIGPMLAAGVSAKRCGNCPAESHRPW